MRIGLSSAPLSLAFPPFIARLRSHPRPEVRAEYHVRLFGQPSRLAGAHFDRFPEHAVLTYPLLPKNRQFKWYKHELCSHWLTTTSVYPAMALSTARVPNRLAKIASMADGGIERIR